MANILVPSRKILLPQQALAVDREKIRETRTLFAAFAGTQFRDIVAGRVLSNAGTMKLASRGRVASFNGSQSSNLAFTMPNGYTGLVVAARIRANGTQPGDPGTAFGIFTSNTDQGGFGVGFNSAGDRVGTTPLTTNGTGVDSYSPATIGRWYTVYAEVTGNGNGFAACYVDGKPAQVQVNYSGGMDGTPNEIVLGSQHRASGFLRWFNGDVEWAALLQVPGATVLTTTGLTPEIAARLYESNYPYNLLRPTESKIWVAVTGGGATNYTLTADVGSYSLTGQAASLFPTFKRTLVADAASYSLTGQDALLSYIPGGVDYYMPADGGGYTSSGQDAGLTVVRKYALPADVGSYTLNGQAANFSVVRKYALAADVGSYTLNGQDAILAYAPGSGAYVLAADVGTYTSTGQGAATRFNARVDGSTGTYTSTGQGAALTVARRLPGAAGTYQITGNDATLTFVGVMAYTLSGETGTYTLNGSPATLTGPADVSTRRGGWAPEMPRRKKERVDRILDDVLAVLEEQKEPERVVRRAKKTLHRVARAEQVQNLAELDTKVDLAEVEDAVTRVIHKAIKEAKVKRRRKQDEELLLML